MSTKPEIVAFHLPQFHCIPENDEWWGKGFTEWDNTKKGIPLFNGHNQPREPYGDNYYDLSRKEDLIWEMQLAKKYGISAFCYYHYWFNGKLLLQKPLETMLTLEERIDYFFCWANEPWIRSWEGSKKILMPQNYGGQKEWQQHFDYLLPFFQGKHYRKINGCPVFVNYRSNNIPNCEEMIKYFDHCCKNNGFSGIYIIEERNNFQTKSTCRNSNAILDFEPMFTLTHGRSKKMRVFDKIRTCLFNKKTKNNLLLFDYDKVWELILNRKYDDLKKHYLGAFVDWDNTARKGKNGTVVYGYTPEKFEKYLKKQVNRCQEYGSEMLFINAWNEWGEGTYLEPDKKYGFKNLEAVLKILSKIGMLTYEAKC